MNQKQSMPHEPRHPGRPARAVLLLLAGFMAGLWSCSDSTTPWGDLDNPLDPENIIPVSGISLDQSNLVLSVGGSASLSATISPANASNHTLSWSSNATDVATVDANGLVTAAAAGTATITATTSDGGYTAHCTVTVFVVTPVMIEVSSGTFNNRTANVTVSTFSISQYEITQLQYRAVMGSNPSWFPSVTNGPVEQVCWYDALVFCNRLSIREGLTPVYSIGGSTDPAAWGTVPTDYDTTWDGVIMDMAANGYRLPTEAEWEFAARGGTLSQGYEYAGSNNVNEVAWYRENSNDTTHAVGGKLPNELGLYDMSGNVWEWCWDWYGSYSSSAQTDPTGGASGLYRVVRGGGWIIDFQYQRSAKRGYDLPCFKDTTLGFRVVCRESGTSNTIPVTGISLDRSTLSLASGGTARLSAAISPANASNQSVSWSSSASAVATVDANGLVTAIAAGMATITATTTDGGYTANCTVTVIQPIQSAAVGTLLPVVGGTFDMGSTMSSQEQPVHEVSLSTFYMSTYEITQTQYAAVMGRNPSYFTGVANGPVERVSWYDALVFCNSLSLQEGRMPAYNIGGSTDPAAWGAVPTTSLDSTWNAVTMDLTANGYRLPTEAEWEYAARGGTRSQGFIYAGSNTADDVAWYYDNSGDTTHASGTKLPNGLGLYDMSGNVWEWCWDWYGSYTDSTQTSPLGPVAGLCRVLRGGSWLYKASYLRSTNREIGDPDGRFYATGFRVLLPQAP